MQVLRDGIGFETVQVERLGELDGQGMPSYESALEIKARVVREDSMVKQSNGSEVQSVATVWIDAQQDPIPGEQDRLVFEDGLIGIVIERHEGRTLSGVVDHYRVRAKKEGA